MLFLFPFPKKPGLKPLCRRPLVFNLQDWTGGFSPALLPGQGSPVGNFPCYLRVKWLCLEIFFTPGNLSRTFLVYTLQKEMALWRRALFLCLIRKDDDD